VNAALRDNGVWWRGERRSRVSCVSGEREEMLSFDSERYVSRSLHRASASFD
jgi:hypothetical protein